MDYLRKSLEAEGISKRASTLITSSRRIGSTSHYESGWKKFCHWCLERQISPTGYDISAILDFLAQMFEENFAYNTIAGYRSAISAFHDPVEGTSIGEHPRVSSLMTGIFNKRPPITKNSQIWDVEKVLSYIRNLPQNKDLSDKLLTLRL